MGLNIFSNILSVVFSLFSLTMVIPFLGILFGTQEKVLQASPLTFSADSIKENFYFFNKDSISSAYSAESSRKKFNSGTILS